MSKWLLTLILLLLPVVYSYTQTGSVVAGVVLDSMNKPITGASVVLYEVSTKKIAAFAITNVNGMFQIQKSLLYPVYLLEVSIINYAKYSETLLLSNLPKTGLMKIVLKNSATMLKEVVIVSKPSPIKQKGDTTEYNASSFRDATTKTVEELLKKLPGVTVNDNGTILFKGRQVEKVLIEGDDLFDRKYQLLTKNFNATAIDKVQAIDNYLENPLLKGIESSEKVALNLTLDKAFKNKLSGDVTAGAGNNGFYDVKSTFFNISRKAKLVLIANHDNTGNMPSDTYEYLNSRPEFLKEPDLFLYNVGEASVPLFRTNRLSNTATNLNVFTGLYRLTPNIKLKTLFYGLYGSQSNNNWVYEKYNFSSNVNWESLVKNHFKEKQFSSAGNLELNMTLRDSAAIKYKFNYGHQQNRYGNSSIVSLAFSDSMHEAVTNRPDEIFSEVTYQKKLSGKSVIDISYQHYWATVVQQVAVVSNRYFALFQADSSYRQLFNNTQKKEYHQVFAIRHQLVWGRHKIAASFSASKQRYYITTNMDIFNGIKLRKAGDSYGQDNKTSLQDYSIKVSDALEWKNTKLRFTATLKRTTYLLSNYRSDSSWKETAFFVIPGISFSHRFWRYHLLSFTYNSDADNPRYQYLLPGYYLRSLNTFEQGAYEFERIRRNNFFTNYSYNNLMKQIELTAGFYRLVANKNYTALLTLSPFLSFNTITPFRGNRISNIDITIRKLIPTIKSNVKWGLLYSHITYFNAINGNANVKNKVQSKGTTLALNSGFSGFFNYDIRFGYQQWKAGAKGNSNSNITDSWNASAIFKFQLSKAWFALVKSEWHQYSRQPLAVFFDGKLSYNPAKSMFGFHLALQNILNVKQYATQAFTPLQENTQTFQVLPFYALLSVSYHFQ
jgi:hypothetical protein